MEDVCLPAPKTVETTYELDEPLVVTNELDGQPWRVERVRIIEFPLGGETAHVFLQGSPVVEDRECVPVRVVRNSGLQAMVLAQHHTV